VSHITKVLEFLFGCHHSNLSRVFTIGQHSYRVCCDCGAEFEYSLEKMALHRRQFVRIKAPARAATPRIDGNKKGPQDEIRFSYS